MPVRRVLNLIVCDLKNQTINYREDVETFQGQTVLSSTYHRTVVNDRSDLKDAPAQVKAIAAIFFRGN